MQITQLGYIGIEATDPDAWRKYAADFLGMQVDGSQRLRLRMDARPQRMLVEPSARDGAAFFGFEVADARALKDAAGTLEEAGVEVHGSTKDEQEWRQVAEMVWFPDPDGNRIELYYGPADADDPFTPSRPIGGFRAGDLGLGHVVLGTDNFEAMEDFYKNLLNFRLSDFIAAKPFRASFFHINPRHHTLAIIETPERGVHHVMIEYNFMDDVGRLYDMALDQPDCIAVTLGRHSNDHVLSFYSRSPGGFMIETGWGGRLVDDATWQPEALYGPSIWGHERSWLPPEARASARKQRDLAARQGVLEPTEVIRSKAFNLEKLEK